ncbi:MAG: RrF2 family transcriptional regulator, partial [Leptonema sp. (in: bacteria)]
MFFSKRSNYGIQALVFLYKFKDKKKFFKSKEIADRLGIKPSYLTKILQDLVKEGVLISTTGPEGGFALPKGNEDINLLQIYSFLENKNLLSDCV